MKNYQSIYPHLKRVLASATQERKNLRADMSLGVGGLEIRRGQQAALARRLNNAFEDVPTRFSADELEHSNTIRDLAIRVRNASALLSSSDLREQVYSSMKSSFGLDDDDDLPQDTPVSDAPDLGRLKRNLVRDVGGFNLEELEEAWSDNEPYTVEDVVGVVEKARET